jgi:hypothetical protein
VTIYRPKGKPFYHYDFQMKGIRYHGSTHCVSKRDAERYERDLRTEIASGRREKPTITLDLGQGSIGTTRANSKRTARPPNTSWATWCG